MILKLFPQWIRHRSHHTQNIVPNVVARHQFRNTMYVEYVEKISNGWLKKTNVILKHSKNVKHRKNFKSVAKEDK